MHNILISHKCVMLILYILYFVYNVLDGYPIFTKPINGAIRRPCSSQFIPYTILYFFKFWMIGSFKYRFLRTIFNHRKNYPFEFQFRYINIFKKKSSTWQFTGKYGDSHLKKKKEVHTTTGHRYQKSKHLKPSQRGQKHLKILKSEI